MQWKIEGISIIWSWSDLGDVIQGQTDKISK